MKNIRLALVIQLTAIAIGCHSTQKPERIPADSLKATPGPVVTQKATIKPNASRVTGIISSLELIDSVRFSVSFQVDSSGPAGSMESFAEAGQQLVATPQFVLDGQGLIDMNNERNQKLMGVRNTKPGDVFVGKIVLAPNGKWVIVDVGSR